MDNAAYHAHPAVSKSHLDLIARSPLHYWARYLDPNRVAPEPSPQMRLGTALHTHVLELSRWDEEIAVAPSDINRRTKEGREQWAAFEASSVGKTVITADDAAQVMAMGRAVLRHPAAAMLLGMPGKAETTHMWTDASTGLECKCRPDWLMDDGSIVVDLKTTKDASPRGFKQSIANFSYQKQAAWYLHGLEQATGRRPDQFIFICVESTAPYACAVYAADAEMIERGHDQAMRDLAKLAVCKAADHWPSYSDQIETISLPGWMTGQAGQQQQAPETIQEF
jgi:exodeoxyribonuclease VIII